MMPSAAGEGPSRVRRLSQAAPTPAAPAPAASAPAAPAGPAAPAAAPGPRPSGVIGTFLIRTGALKGQRLAVKTPIVNIGRADYNDLVIPDESISTSHAKLQRREGIWTLVDLDSTNGCFVDGERVQGEATLAPGASVRFGDVSAIFDPTDDQMGVAKGGGTKMIQAMKVEAPPPAPAAPAAKPAAPPPVAPAPRPAPAPKRAAAPAAPEKKGKGCGASVIVVALGSAAFVYWIFA